VPFLKVKPNFKLAKNETKKKKERKKRNEGVSKKMPPKWKYF